MVCRIVRYQVGVFKERRRGSPRSTPFPKGATKLPALLEMHGGGQSAVARQRGDRRQARLCRHFHQLGRQQAELRPRAGDLDGPQTDWGKLDATHPPQRNKVNHFAGALTPDEYTLDTVESPRNSNWFLVLMAARRAITFLEAAAGSGPARGSASTGIPWAASSPPIWRGSTSGSRPPCRPAAVRETFWKARPTCRAASRSKPAAHGTGLHLRQRLHPADHLPGALAVAHQRLPRPHRQHGLELAQLCPMTACVSASRRT